MPACEKLEHLLWRFHQSFVMTANVSGLTMFRGRVYGSPQTINSVQPYRRGCFVSHVNDLLPHYTAQNKSRYFCFIIRGSSMVMLNWHLNHLTTYTHKNHTCANTAHQLTLLTCPPAWTLPPPNTTQNSSPVLCISSFIHQSTCMISCYYHIKWPVCSHHTYQRGDWQCWN